MSFKNKRMSKKGKAFKSILPGSPLGVNVVEGDIHYALQTWKRKMKDSGVMKELYKRTEYTKPSKARRKVLLNAIYKQQNNIGN